MDTRKLLKTFKLINKAFFETANNELFLRIELEIKSLSKVVKYSEEILHWLDLNGEKDRNYFCDIYSSGTDKIILYNDLSNYIDKNIKVFLSEKILEKDSFIGKLISTDPLTIKWNKKGQIRKTSIEKNKIKEIKLFAKVGK